MKPLGETEWHCTGYMYDFKWILKGLVSEVSEVLKATHGEEGIR